MISSLGGHMVVPLDKIIEEIAASASHFREWASMRVMTQVENRAAVPSHFHRPRIIR